MNITIHGLAGDELQPVDYSPRWKNAVTIVKYINIVQVSIMVEISGAAMMAGSTPIFFARSGSVQPIHFAMATTAIIVMPNANASITS